MGGLLEDNAFRAFLGTSDDTGDEDFSLLRKKFIEDRKIPLETGLAVGISVLIMLSILFLVIKRYNCFESPGDNVRNIFRLKRRRSFDLSANRYEFQENSPESGGTSVSSAELIQIKQIKRPYLSTTEKNLCTKRTLIPRQDSLQTIGENSETSSTSFSDLTKIREEESPNLESRYRGPTSSSGQVHFNNQDRDHRSISFSTQGSTRSSRSSAPRTPSLIPAGWGSNAPGIMVDWGLGPLQVEIDEGPMPTTSTYRAKQTYIRQGPVKQA